MLEGCEWSSSEMLTILTELQSDPIRGWSISLVLLGYTMLLVQLVFMCCVYRSNDGDEATPMTRSLVELSRDQEKKHDISNAVIMAIVGIVTLIYSFMAKSFIEKALAKPEYDACFDRKYYPKEVPPIFFDTDWMITYQENLKFIYPLAIILCSCSVIKVIYTLVRA